ncbi:MAG TPA: threonine/serine exporter family protein [Pseudonocardia sp.]|nr:threonine/serine exporter family protein [Pseudonocardia sp.]
MSRLNDLTPAIPAQRAEDGPSVPGGDDGTRSADDLTTAAGSAVPQPVAPENPENPESQEAGGRPTPRTRIRIRRRSHGDGKARVRAHRLARRTRQALGRSRLRAALSDLATLGTDVGPSSEEGGEEIGPSVPDDSHVQQVLELAIRIGEVLLSSGETVADTTAAMLRVADASGLPSCDVDITFTSITMCCHRGMEAGPVTTMRLVRYRSLDLTRLTQVADLVQRLERDEIATADASTELSALTSARHPYPRWLATLAWSTMAASIAVLLGGGAAVAGVAFAATGIIDRVGRLLNRAELPFIFQQLTGAALATGSTVALLWLNVLPPGTRPSLVVAAALTVLLSGLSVVGAVRDAIDGYFLTATARAAEGAMLSAGLLAGVVLALKAGVYLGVSLEVADQLPPTDGVAVARLVAAGLTSAMFALAGYSPLKFLPTAALTGSLLWGIYTVLEASGFGPVVATGGAAVCLGVGTGLLHHWTAVPRLVMTLAGITPLLPGLTAYRGFYQLGVIGAADGLVTIILATAIGLALAGGVALGEWTIDRLTGRWVPRHTAATSIAAGPVQAGPGQ